jgi:hypothetical protein
MADVALNWATAEVKGGKLTVELEGKPAKAWKESFETTVTLLRGGDWGEVQVKKNSVRVSDLSPGSEDKLRHHLESIVEQANAAVRPSESEGDGVEADPDSPDARMTQSFRAFAEDSEAQERA